MSHLLNDEAVYRTAPATPGLLITELYNWTFKFYSKSSALIALDLFLLVTLCQRPTAYSACDSQTECQRARVLEGHINKVTM